MITRGVGDQTVGRIYRLPEITERGVLDAVHHYLTVAWSNVSHACGRWI
jgi:hypothetical protein